ncbi:hypothetical protein [Nonomuraea insulae]|uniref:Secreted protein n=1 Tax=Nonomuraea insulae TaxID=1616787 RepID=A0ABW1CFS5_9ACTN
MQPIMRTATLTALLMVQALPAAAARADDESAPPPLSKLSSFRVMPRVLHQKDVLRVLMKCPVRANHAVIGSTAFTLKGSWRSFREVGVNLSNGGFGKHAIPISRFAEPGHHDVHIKCVKVTLDHATGFKKVKLLSRASTPILIHPVKLHREPTSEETPPEPTAPATTAPPAPMAEPPEGVVSTVRGHLTTA